MATESRLRGVNKDWWILPFYRFKHTTMETCFSIGSVFVSTWLSPGHFRIIQKSISTFYYERNVSKHTDTFGYLKNKWLGTMIASATFSPSLRPTWLYLYPLRSDWKFAWNSLGRPCWQWPLLQVSRTNKNSPDTIQEDDLSIFWKTNMNITRWDYITCIN